MKCAKSKHEIQPDNSVKMCLLCQNLYEERGSNSASISAKVLENCQKYLHSHIIENNFREYLNQLPSENETVSMCPKCLQSSVQLTELDDKLQIIQKSMNDFVLTFYSEVIHRRTKISGALSQQRTVEIDICKFSDVIGENGTGSNEIVNPDLNKDGEVQIEFESVNREGFNSIENGGDGLNVASESTPIPTIAKEGATATSSKNKLVDFKKKVQINLQRLQLPIKKNGHSASHEGPVVSKAQIANAIKSKKSRIHSIDKSHGIQEHRRHLKYNNIDIISCPVSSTCSPNQRVPLSGHKCGKKKFKCSFCLSVCTTYSNLVIHNGTQTREKPYRCLFCKKCFAQSDACKRHERVHMRRKLFKCPICSQISCTAVN